MLSFVGGIALIFVSIAFIHALHVDQLKMQWNEAAGEVKEQKRIAAQEAEANSEREAREAEAFRAAHIQCGTCQQWLRLEAAVCEHCGRPLKDPHALWEFLLKRAGAEAVENRGQLEAALLEALQKGGASQAKDADANMTPQEKNLERSKSVLTPASIAA